MIEDQAYYRRQQARVRADLDKRGLEGLLVLNPVHVFYLSGYQPNPPGIMERPVALFIDRDEGRTTLMLSIDAAAHTADQPADGDASERLSEAPGIDDVLPFAEYPYADGVPTMEWISRQVEARGFRGRRIGVEDNYTTLNDGVCRNWFAHIEETFTGEVVPAGDLVSILRMVKEPEEVELLRAASFWADELVRELSQRIKPGRHVRELGEQAGAVLLERMRTELGTLTTSPANGQIILEGTPHGFIPSGSGYEPGTIPADQPIIVNCVVCVGGYHGESERCGIVEPPTSRQKELFDIAMESQLRALAAVKPGVRCGDVDAIAAEFIRDAGFDYLYGVGHGIGLLGHEPPWVRPNSETVLEPNMVICVEPGLAVPGEGSFHNSQTVLVTEDGNEPLTVYEGLHRIDFP